MALRDPRKLAAMAYDGRGTFELGIVSEVFGLFRPELNVPWYEFRVFSAEGHICPIRPTGSHDHVSAFVTDSPCQAGDIQRGEDCRCLSEHLRSHAGCWPHGFLRRNLGNAAVDSA